MDRLTSHPDVDTDPHFAPEAQEVFTTGERVFLKVAGTYSTYGPLSNGSEGAYVGRHRTLGAVCLWDTPDGQGMVVTVPFEMVRNLYR